MRFFVRLSYLGTEYHGWQYQPNAMSVQEKLEKAFSIVLQSKTDITGAGRTDTGVHAKNFIAHFPGRITYQIIIGSDSGSGFAESLEIMSDPISGKSSVLVASSLAATWRKRWGAIWPARSIRVTCHHPMHWLRPKRPPRFARRWPN